MRAEFPLLETCVYLNSNSAGATPRGAKAALDEYWRTIEHWRDEAWERWWDGLQGYADMVRGLGVEEIRRRSLAQTDHIIERADEAGLAVATPREHERRGGIVALRFPGDAAVARGLVDSGFVCSYRNGLRIAPHFYNTDEEVDSFMDNLVQRVWRAAA